MRIELSGSDSEHRVREMTRHIMTFLAAAILFVAVPAHAERLVDSDDYKDKDFRKCFISDYADMVDGDDIQWVWINPSVKLAGHRLKVGKVENKSQLRSKSLIETVRSAFADNFEDTETKGGNGTLTADVCIYEAEHFSAGKAWIPFVGGHQMQAGLGVEMVLRDGKNGTVAKFRHSAREGAEIEAAAQEVVGDLMKYVGDH